MANRFLEAASAQWKTVRRAFLRSPERSSGRRRGLRFESLERREVLTAITVSIDAPPTAQEGIAFTVTGQVSPAQSYTLDGDTDKRGYYLGFPTVTDEFGNFTVSYLFGDDGPHPGNGTSSDVEPIEVEVWPVDEPTNIASDEDTVIVENVNPTLDFQVSESDRLFELSGIVHEYSEAVPMSDYQLVRIDWGDTSPEIILCDVVPNQLIDAQYHSYPNVTQTYTIRVTVTDDDTGQAVFEEDVTVTGISLQGLTVEEHHWGDDEQTWFPEGDPLWMHDEHRWSTTIVPSSAQADLDSIEWMAEAYTGQTEPLTDGEVFAEVDSAIPAIASPGLGDWLIWPVATFFGALQVKGQAQPRKFHVASVQWEGFDPGDGQTNLYDGTRMYPERNHPLGTMSGGQPIDQIHNRVNVKVAIDRVRDVETVLRVKIFDPDSPLGVGADPNDVAGAAGTKPDDNSKAQARPQDAWQHAVGVDQRSFSVTIPAGQLSHSKVVTLTEMVPGSDFIAAVHDELAVINDIKFKEDGVTLFVDRSLDIDVPPAYHTPILTVWRTLWVESDHMIAPVDAEGPFNGDPACGGGAPNHDACDDPKATPGLPTIATLYNLMLGANVVVEPLPLAYDPTDETDFKHYQDTAQTDGRDQSSSQSFWSIRMLGAYEWQQLLDNDPDGEVGSLLGWSTQDGAAANPTNFVFYETTRDMRLNIQDAVDLPTALDRVSAHEALHRFFGWHGVTAAADEGIMQQASVVLTAAGFALTDNQIKIIQQTLNPK